MKKILTWIKQFIFFVIKEIVSFFIKFTLFLIVIVGIAGVIIGLATTKKTNGDTLYINLGRNILEKPNPLANIIDDGGDNFYTILRKLNQARDDEKIKRILLNVQNLTLNNAQVEELGEILDTLQNKDIIVYAENYTNKNYKLALHSKTIVAPPTATAESFITGYYRALPYLKTLISQLGIDVNVIHIGNYKAYGENYTRKTMSPEFRKNITRLNDIVFDDFTKEISKYRSLNLPQNILDGEYIGATPMELKNSKLIDKYAYLNDMKNNFKLINIDDYELDIKGEPNAIAVIYAVGDIKMDGKIGITPNNFRRDLKIALKDDDIKGIVIRIDSSGGSALASNIIYHDLVKANKPIYISIGGIAASGGYYIASGGKKIFASPESITGSIGVVSLIPNFEKLTQHIGVNMEVIQKGKFADIYSLTQKFTPQDREKIYNSSLKVYDEFVGVVAKSRKKDKSYINSLAQGQVWLGSEALQNGLIDEIGGIDEAIKNLAKDYNIQDYEIVEITETPKLRDALMEYSSLARTYFEAREVISSELYLKPIYYLPYKVIE